MGTTNAILFRSVLYLRTVSRDYREGYEWLVRSACEAWNWEAVCKLAR
mgnify:CR=1 FL=1